MNRLMNMRFGAAVVLGLSLATASNGQSRSHQLPSNLVINDSTPGELTITWSNFEFSGGVTAPTASPSTSAGTWTVAGESASFLGDWELGGNPSSTGTGVIYLVDPGQANLIRARIDVTWTNNFSDAQFDPLVVTSTPFGSNLGTLPAAFAGLGVPMPNGSIAVEGLFRDPVTAASVSLPADIFVSYIGDLVPECEHPVLLSQPTGSLVGLRSDSGTGGTEQADDVMFSQDVVVRSMRWWGVNFSSGTAEVPDIFRMEVYEDAGGVPAATPVSTMYLSNASRTGTGVSYASVPEFVYAATLPAPMTLKANKRYWLTIINDTTADTNDDWYWTESLVGNSVRASRTPPFSGVWNPSGNDFALELCGTTSSLDCPTDFNGDNMTDGADLAALLASWGPCGPPLPLVIPSDPSNRIDMLTETSSEGSVLDATQR